MTLKEFLTDKTLTSVEITEQYNLIYNIYIDQAGYGLDIDTSNVEAGTQLTMRQDFTLENNILSVAGIYINTAETNML